MKYFEDLTDGERLICRPVVLGRAEILEFAARYDPLPFHVDEARAAASVFGGLVASSLHTISACTRVVVDSLLGEVAIVAGIGIERVDLHQPVRPDDVLQINAWWNGLKPSSNPERGFANLGCRVENQAGAFVLEYGYRYLIARRG